MTIVISSTDLDVLESSDCSARVQECLYAGLNELLVLVGPEPCDIRDDLLLMLAAAIAGYEFTTALKEAVMVLRRQRDDALDEMQFWRERGTANAHAQVANNLALEMELGSVDARRVLDLLVGESNYAVSRFTRRELEVALARAAEELSEDAACLDGLYDEDDDDVG